MRKNTLILSVLALITLPLAPRLMPGDAGHDAIGEAHHTPAGAPVETPFVTSEQYLTALSSSLRRATGISTSTVQAIVYDNPRVQRCFVRAPGEVPLPPRLEINFHIYPGGAVSHASILHPRGHEAGAGLEACLGAALEVDRFEPTGDNGVSVTLPFFLQRSDAAPG